MSSGTPGPASFESRVFPQPALGTGLLAARQQMGMTMSFIVHYWGWHAGRGPGIKRKPQRSLPTRLAHRGEDSALRTPRATTFCLFPGFRGEVPTQHRQPSHDPRNSRLSLYRLGVSPLARSCPAIQDAASPPRARSERRRRSAPNLFGVQLPSCGAQEFGFMAHSREHSGQE
jgi:hypothetical protein